MVVALRGVGLSSVSSSSVHDVFFAHATSAFHTFVACLHMRVDRFASTTCLNVNQCEIRKSMGVFVQSGLFLHFVELFDYGILLSARSSL